MRGSTYGIRGRNNGRCEPINVLRERIDDVGARINGFHECNDDPRERNKD